MSYASRMKAKYKYLTRCDRCGRFTWYETEQQCHCEYPQRDTCPTCGNVVEDYEKMVRCTGTLKLI